MGYSVFHFDPKFSSIRTLYIISTCYAFPIIIGEFAMSSLQLLPKPNQEKGWTHESVPRNKECAAISEAGRQFLTVHKSSVYLFCLWDLG